MGGDAEGKDDAGDENACFLFLIIIFMRCMFVCLVRLRLLCEMLGSFIAVLGSTCIDRTHDPTSSALHSNIKNEVESSVHQNPFLELAVLMCVRKLCIPIQNVNKLAMAHNLG